MRQDINVWKKSKEREINLIDLVWEILHGWRLLLILAMFFGIFLGGLKFYSDRNSLEVKEQTSASLEALRESLSEDEQESLTQAEFFRKQLDEKNQYLQESIWINLNAYEQNVVTLEYVILPSGAQGNSAKDKALVEMYVSYINNKGMQKQLREKLEWEIPELYIGELVFVSTENTDSQVDANSDGNYSLVVRIAGKDMEQANLIADALTSLLEEYQSEVTEKMGQHMFVSVDRFESTVVNHSLADQQLSITNAIATLYARVNNLTADFSEVQRQVFEGEEPTTLVSEVREPMNLSINKIYMVLGAVMGIMLGCVWIALKYILSGKIENIEDVQEIYGIHVIGSLTSGERKKRFGQKVDDWLDSLRKNGIYSPEEQRERCVSKIKVAYKKENIQQLFVFLPADLNEYDREVVDGTMEQLREVGVEVLIKENMNSNMDVFEAIGKNDWVMLFVKEGKTQYRDLEKELILCEEYRVKILGIIGIGILWSV